MTESEISQGATLTRRAMLLAATATVAACASGKGSDNQQASVAESTNAGATNSATGNSAGPLASWNDGPAKQAILDFVRVTTDKSNESFVPPEDRIATFDQDGTLWTEHPLYTQAEFILDRAHTLAPQHPELKRNSALAALSGDVKAMAAATETDWSELVAATHGGLSIEAYAELVAGWLRTAKHPRFNRLYTELVYRPMLEVMDYFRANGFKTYIVTGGGQEFVRVYAQQVYGVPSEQVIGSFIGTTYEYVNGKPELRRLSNLLFSDNNDGKAIGINLFIGKRPYAAFGNSTGDQQMLEWTGAGGGARLKMLVLHDDAQREYAYGPADGLPDTKVGTFSTALMTEAKAKGWTVISMKNDWTRIFV
jgi:phosphoglycolate phosphatase-like HAD superfamily hydrolase